MQLVVVMAVRKAVSAATNTFAPISMILFFIIFIRYPLPLVFVEAIVISCAGVDHQRAGLCRHREVASIHSL